MMLGELLNMKELRDDIAAGRIKTQRHPTLPLLILNYSSECMFDDYWTDTVQHCRGLIIETGKFSGDILPESTVIARPFHKFFNLNHTSQPMYHEGNLPSVVPTVTEKMDGWFGILWKYGEQYGVASRGSFTSPGAEFATAKLQKLVKYGAVEEFPKGYSPIFEIIFKAGKVVIDYPFEGLVLLGCINIETGEELPYDELQDVWAKIAGYSVDNRPWIRLVKAHRMSLAECSNFEHLVLPEEKRGMERGGDGSVKNQEGFVVSYPRPGTWPIKVKIKFEDYKRLHKLITGVTPQQIWKALHDPMAQWLAGEVPDHFRGWAIKWRDELYSQFQLKLASVMSLAQRGHTELIEAGIGDDRKMLFTMMNTWNPEHATIAMSLLDGKIYQAHQAIWNSIRPVGRESETFYREGQGE